MQIFQNFIFAVALSLITACAIGPLVIRITRRIKFKQPVYEYVTMHKGKEGTPTMGGIIFLIAIAVGSFFAFEGENSISLVALAVTLGFGIIGFLDDYIKIKNKQNLGLRAYQKVISQLVISTLVAVFVYKSEFISSEIFVPFFNITIDFGYFIIPFIIFVFISITNSVKLTDGLDGLAGGVSVAYLISFCATFMIILFRQIDNGLALNYINEYSNLLVVAGAGIGGLLGYLMYNSYPAQIFMGDTGSLALGGLLGCITIFSKQTLLIPIIGAMFVASSVSVAIQVIVYKLKHKRVFLMAPLHHHFEKKGVNETKIVAIYIVITIIFGVICCLATSMFFKA